MIMNFEKIAFEKLMSSDYSKKQMMMDFINDQYNGNIDEFLKEHTWCTGGTENDDNIMVHIFAGTPDSVTHIHPLKASVGVNAQTGDSELFNTYEDKN